MAAFQKTLWFFGVTLLLFTLARLSLWWVYADYFGELTLAQVGFALLHGVRFDASVALTFLLPWVLLLNLPLRWVAKQWFQRVLGWGIFAVFLAYLGVLVGDVVYFNWVKRHLAGELFLLGNDYAILSDMALLYWQWVILASVLVVVLAVFWRSLVRLPIHTNRYGWLVLVLVLLGSVAVIRGSFDKKPINVIHAYSEGNSKLANLTLNGVFTTLHYGNQGGQWANFFSDQEARAIMGLPEQRYPLRKSYPARAKKPNVVFVLLESWTPQYIDAFGGGHYGVTPNFDKLAREGVMFTQFYAAGQRSIEGIQATLTGVPPLKGMPTLGFGLEVANLTPLGKLANQHGYNTIFLQTSHRNSFYVDKIAQTLGFSQYFGAEDTPPQLDYPDPYGSKFGWDYETYLKLFETIQKDADKPFFAYLFTGATHAPYARLQQQFEKYPYDEGENGFYNLLYYADWALGEFMQRARAQPWFDNTVFVFTADHVFANEQSGDLRRKFNTPLVIYAPALYPARVETRVFSQLDIMPTLIDILGFDDPFYAVGDSVFRKTAQEAFVNEGGIGAVVTDQGYLKHSYSTRLEVEGEPDALDRMERKVKALAQLTIRLIGENRWAE